ncbi:MAG TPA: HEAT repeat domain-containing protein [Thermoanaerobaculia bacterium]|nr:HEAT repeat domain-containing protein [Thermoanaerobaculia bacterium]
MNRFPLRAAGALLGATIACGGARRPSTVPREAAPAAPPKTSFASTLEARATMLMLEDERRFEPAAIDAAAGNPDAAVRAAAARAAGATGGAAALPVLASLSRDPDARVRSAAALGLETAGRPEGSAPAESLLSDGDSGVRCAAGRAVALLGAPSGEAALIAAVRSEPRPCLLYALARFGNEEAAAVARELAGSPSAELRRAAVYAFARTPVPGSSAALILAAADPDGETAEFAVRGLGVLREPGGLAALLAALDRREPGVRTLALDAIAAIEEKGAAPVAAERVARVVALSRTADPNVATAAIAALRAFPADREAFRALHAMAVSGAGRRRDVAFVSEMAILKDRGRGRIGDASASPDVAFRAAAASALAFLSEEAAGGLREAFLRDSSPRVRAAAAGTFPLDAEHRAALALLLADPDVAVRTAVVDRLAETGDPSVLGPIRSAMPAFRADGMPDAALAAVFTAARLKGDEARALLEAAIDWPRVVVAREARRALIEDFGGDAAALALPSYPTGLVLSDYEKILERSAVKHRATVTTPRGAFTIELDAPEAPLTVSNFESLARGKFFDGTSFDHVVPGFGVLAGDPTATTHGGPGYEIRDEIGAAACEAGCVGMALDGRDTGGSQWFVALSRQPHVEGRYPLFGRVIQGQETVTRTEEGDRVISVGVSP